MRENLSVLVVDDEPAILTLISAILQRNGIRPLVAKSAAEALEIAARDYVPLDLLLTDVVMPDVSGPELAKKLCEVRPDLRVIYMSAYPDSDILRIELKQRGGSVIPKPFDNRGLVEAIRSALAKSVPGAGSDPA